MEKILVKDTIEEMLFNDQARGLLEKTINKHRKFLKMFNEYLVSFQVQYIDEVKPVHIKQFMIKKQKDSGAESYINSFLRSIRALFRYCVEEEYIPETIPVCAWRG